MVNNKISKLLRSLSLINTKKQTKEQFIREILTVHENYTCDEFFLRKYSLKYTLRLS